MSFQCENQHENLVFTLLIIISSVYLWTNELVSEAELFNRVLSIGVLVLILLSLSFISCTQQEEKEETKIEETSAMTKAVCVLNPTEGNEVSGIVTFTKTDGGIKIVANFEGLTPGNHGFHIHEFGDCSS